MAKKGRALNILMIDDEIAEMTDFIQLGKLQRVTIREVDNTEEGLEILSKDFHRFDGIILDAKSFKTKGAEKGTETVGALRKAIDGIDAICRQNERQIPYCVYTAHMDLMGDAWGDDLVSFVKGKEQEKLFSFLKAKAANIQEDSIIQGNYEVFELWDKCDFNSEYKGVLISLFQNVDTTNTSTIKSELRNIRPILEGLFWHLYNNGDLIEGVADRRGINLNDCVRLLSNRDVYEARLNYSVPDNIGWQISMIKEITSEMGSHRYAGKVYNYSLKTVLYALCNVLIWYKDFIIEKKNASN